jgi:aminoglycoside phosphotransferase (APT) family kinase protein
MSYVDKPTEVRDGEQLDTEKVRQFLIENIDGLKGDLQIEQFPSGFSNLTYLIKVGDREMILRRPPFGKKAKTAHDMGREYNILNALTPVFPYCPKPLAYAEDSQIMDCPFYVMERIEGIILRKDLPSGMQLSADHARKLCENLVDVQCRLHRLDYKEIGLADFGKPQGYVERQVQGWSKRYRDARTDDAPDFERVMQWLEENRPPDSQRATVIHNDYKFDNVVLDPDDPLKIIGVLDWEMATIGDPLMDLGCSLGYWVSGDDPSNLQMMRQLPTTLDGMLSREEIVRLYGEKMELEIGSFDFYLCFGFFRLAVIAQQIYYRFYHGQTKDRRFAVLVFAVKILEETALAIVEKAG